MFQKSSYLSDAFTFRRFSRKGYALFAALGREVKVGVLTVATLATAAPCLAEASGTERDFALADRSDDDVTTLDEERRLDEAVSVAARTPMAADVAARPVISLTQQQLAAAGVTCVNDVLKLCAGIDVRQRGGFGLQTDIGINGGTFDQVTLLVNGIAINNPQTGHNAGDFPVNLSDIERIEVLEGAASRVLGAQAFSGAVNLVTRSGARGIDLHAAAGSFGTVRSEVRGAWQHAAGRRQYATSLSGSFQRSDGAVKNGDFAAGKVFWTGRSDDELCRVDAQAGASLNDFGANTFYSALYPNQWEATRRYLLSVKAETKGRIRFAPQVSWMRNDDHFQLIRNTHTAENFHRGEVFATALNAWTNHAWGRTALGAELREELIYSTNLGRPLDEGRYVRIAGKTPVQQPDGTWSDAKGGAAYYTKGERRTNIAYFLEHNLFFERWTLSLGVMAQRNTALDHRFRLYPGIDVAYRPTERWRLYASWNKALRLPTFTDLFYKSPTQEGNRDLRAEENHSFRLGATCRPDAAIALSANAFYHRGVNMIDWVMRHAGDKYHSTNFRLDNFGLGASLELDAERLLGRRQPLRSLRVDYAWMTQRRRDAEVVFKSNYALEYLRHKLVVTLDHRLFGPWAASWAMRLQSRNGHYAVFDPSTHKPTGATAPYGTHARLDLRVHRTTRRLTLFCDLHNLTGHRFFDIANVEQPGFLMLLGGSFRF